MLSIQYYPFGCQNGQQNRQHASLRISLDNPRSLVPMLSVHAVHFALQSSFHAQNSIMSCGAGRALSTRALSISRMDCVRTLPERWVHTVLVVFARLSNSTPAGRLLIGRSTSPRTRLGKGAKTARALNESAPGPFGAHSHRTKSAANVGSGKKCYPQ
jgi:hypothetical protein